MLTVREIRVINLRKKHSSNSYIYIRFNILLTRELNIKLELKFQRYRIEDEIVSFRIIRAIRRFEFRGQIRVGYVLSGWESETSFATRGHKSAEQKKTRYPACVCSPSPIADHNSARDEILGLRDITPRKNTFLRFSPSNRAWKIFN